MNIKNGFTLAEVLITLGIIGVVASMTLPTIVQNTQNKELQTSLKKNYSVLSQALNMYQAENGERITSENIPAWGLKKVLMTYLKSVKDCNMGSESESAKNKACIPNYGIDNENTSTVYKTLTGKTIDLHFFDDGQFVLNDGSLILLENKNVGTVYISVDVNGFNQRPNKLGKDLFMFQIDKKGSLRPMGASGTTYYSDNDEYCSQTSTDNMNGAGCTQKALTDENYFKNLPK